MAFSIAREGKTLQHNCMRLLRMCKKMRAIEQSTNLLLTVSSMSLCAPDFRHALQGCSRLLRQQCLHTLAIPVPWKLLRLNEDVRGVRPSLSELQLALRLDVCRREGGALNHPDEGS